MIWNCLDNIYHVLVVTKIEGKECRIAFIRAAYYVVQYGFYVFTPYLDNLVGGYKKVLRGLSLMESKQMRATCLLLNWIRVQPR